MFEDSLKNLVQVSGTYKRAVERLRHDQLELLLCQINGRRQHAVGSSVGSCTAAPIKLDCRQTQMFGDLHASTSTLLIGLQAKKLGLTTVLIAGKTALEEQGGTARCGCKAHNAMRSSCHEHILGVQCCS